jgi:hypothetical protein
MFNCRFDSLEFERENGYRHPPLYIVLLSFIQEQEEKSRAENCLKNTHVQRLN